MKPVWRIFSSVRLALWIILLLALVSIAGVLLRQMPPAVTADPELVELWLEQIAQPAYGGMTSVYNFFGLFDVFHSPIFLILGGVLIINITVCSLKRWPSLVKIGRGVNTDSAARLLDKGNATRGTSKLSAAEATTTSKGFFTRRGYRVREHLADGGTVLVADKNRFAPWGTYAIHLSLILLIAGYIFGSYSGYTDDAFIVVEGETRAVGFPYDVSIRLESFEDEYYTDGSPKDYRAQVELLVNAQVVEEGLIRVNYPMDYDGLKIYQSFFGPAVTLLINDGEGQEIFHGPVTLPNPFTVDGLSRSSGRLDLPGNDIFVFIINSAGPADPIIPPGEVRLEFYEGSLPESEFIDGLNTQVGTALEFQGNSFTVENELQFSGFQLREDPGLWMIWTAFTLFMIGLGVVFYYPHRQIIIAVHPEVKGSRFSYNILGKKDLNPEEIQSFTQAIGATGQIQPKKLERKS